MKWFEGIGTVYLHREPVDFRQSINGLTVIVEQSMQLSPYHDAVFVFCNRSRDKLKILCWDQTGFVLWYKRLEKAKFNWPRQHAAEVIQVNDETLDWLLRGFDIQSLTPHETLSFDGALS